MENNEKICTECGCVIEDNAHEINGKMYCEQCCSQEFVKCEYCGEMVKQDDATYCDEDGKYYCEECASDQLIWCDRCQSYALYDHSNGVHLSRRYVEWWCSDCIDSYAVHCADCGEWWDIEQCISYRDDYICPSCSENYAYCDVCNSYVHYDEWDSDEECCIECSGSYGLIGEYHNRPTMRFYGDCLPSWRGIWRGIGVELEIDRENHNGDDERATAERLKEIAGDHIYFNRDGSLNHGFEIITQPHTEQAFYQIEWEKILHTCKNYGYSSHNIGTCGLHLHISREMFGTNQARQDVAIAKLIRFYDIWYNDILKISRRTEQQANQWASTYDTKSRKDAENIIKNKYNYGRYFAVNNSNRDTVEIRITRGTLNYNSFIACIDFMLIIAKNSRRVPWGKVENIAEWLKDLKPGTIEYIKSRNAFEGVL